MDLVDAGWLLRPCVYLLLWKESVVYVGQSRKPLSRLYTHAYAMRGGKGPKWLLAKAFRFDGVRIVPTEPDQLLEVERRLIVEYRPRYNIQHNDPRPIRRPKPKVPITLFIRGRQVTLNSPEAPTAPRIVRRV